MNVDELVLAIQRVLKDPKILRAEIIAKLNEIHDHACAQHFNPALITEDTVTVSQNGLNAAMPSDFSHDLLAIYSSTYNHDNIVLRTSPKALYAGFNRSAGGSQISEVATDSEVLHVRPRASADEDLLLTYYATPTTLVNGVDVPDGIPVHLHRKILVSGALVDLLPQSDMDTNIKVGEITIHSNTYRSGLAGLEDLFPNAPRSRPKTRRKVWNF